MSGHQQPNPPGKTTSRARPAVVPRPLHLEHRDEATDEILHVIVTMASSSAHVSVYRAQPEDWLSRLVWARRYEAPTNMPRDVLVQAALRAAGLHVNAARPRWAEEPDAHGDGPEGHGGS